MRTPLSWLREYVDLPAGVDARDVAARLIRAGLEVETVDEAGADVTGPLVVGRVAEFVEETHKNGKTIRWCSVDVGPEHNEDRPSIHDESVRTRTRGIVCGARNFGVGDLVVVALPGAVLPGGFAISARKTYGHVSDGMICSVRELGIGDDHTGILVLGPDEGVPGDDAVPLLHLRDDVLDIAVTPDRGYCLSVRGVAREVAIAYGVPFRDPADVALPPADAPTSYPVRVEDTERCPVFVARRVSGFDPAAPSPRWLRRRVQLAGMRPISLAVDVTNYVMLEFGQPIHGYDGDLLRGPIGVRRAEVGEKLTTLDDVVRTLDEDDLLITDESGPIGLAGVMGGGTTEIGPTTTSIVIEAAHFEATGVARTARRHKLPSEASRRFERGVDPALPAAAASRVAQLLSELGGATVEPGITIAGSVPVPAAVEIDTDLPGRVVGVDYPADEVSRLLAAVGAEVTTPDPYRFRVVPPTWRPDLTDPYDLIEEVARLYGYDAVPSTLPVAPPGRGVSARQRLRRRVERAVAAAGFVEAPSYPFVGEAEFDALGLAPDDPRRRALRLANPISDEQPLLRTTLVPGLLATLRRNVGRGATDLTVYESGLVFRPGPDDAPVAPRLPVDRRPTDEELAVLESAVPEQPRHIAVALCGRWESAGWWGPGRAVSWADAVEAARVVGEAAGVRLRIEQAEQPPWHPGRCAAVYAEATLLGYAGELHPRVVKALGLPERTAVMELNVDALPVSDEPVPAPDVSTFPVATQDVALVVDESVPAAEVESALRAGAGELLESVRLFDVYSGEQIGEGRKSLAYALRFRAPDRTLTVDDTSAARDAAVAAAAERTGAVLRG
ncbi:phenylalanine--tRNA ligase subunit beta [Actinobacteria bacterium YIM 96077]|uniref:Phenylalanine--tRNA ligase beta subunit n=1 Tax=Phytoactinopolyspora halophila TaxID=1981511 RepID=A0A329QIN8_9ACTN|nr:phenylalanine--tRNA ligase subunit beta [Phytoactinopolyspora halophila]AYY13638.1 phenylalanine--tRNA ligase subunit beta [Actinobacteria bacterium YIM 96077]RAW11202.1 phenylalanine--tRNA ligase subunit beta [Phytoactinopolyspora halophila]